MTDQEQEQQTKTKNEKEAGTFNGFRTTATTVAGASMGVVVGIAGVTIAAAMAEIVLPVSLCLWATGLAGGAVGLLTGCKKKEKKNV